MHKIVSGNTGAEVYKGKKAHVLGKWEEVKRKCMDGTIFMPGDIFTLMNGKKVVERATCRDPQEVKEESAAYFYRMLRSKIEDMRKESQNHLDKFKKDLREAEKKGNGYSYTLHWHGAGVFYAESMVNRCENILGNFDVLEKKHKSPLERHQALVESVEKMVECLAGNIRGASWANKSTSPMANIETDMQSEVAVELWDELRDWIKYYSEL